MELVYLANGSACYLKEKIGSKFVVNKIFEYDDEESGWQEIVDENDILVSAVFTTKPVEKIDTEVKELNKKKELVEKDINELTKTKQTIVSEIAKATQTQITNNKFIVNRSEIINAKELVLFPKDWIMPIRYNSEKKSLRGIKLNLVIEISDGRERSWGYELYYDYDSSSHYLCEKYGILINPTEEEVEQTIVKRLAEFEFNNYQLMNAPDKYLSEALLKKKKDIINTEKTQKIERLEKEISDKEAELLNLKL